MLYGKRIRFVWYGLLLFAACCGFFWGISPGQLADTDFLAGEKPVGLRVFLLTCSFLGVFALAGFSGSVIFELAWGASRRRREEKKVLHDVFEDGRKVISPSDLCRLTGVEEEMVLRLVGGRTRECSFRDYQRVRDWLKKVERQ